MKDAGVTLRDQFGDTPLDYAVPAMANAHGRLWFGRFGKRSIMKKLSITSRDRVFQRGAVNCSKTSCGTHFWTPIRENKHQETAANLRDNFGD